MIGFLPADKKVDSIKSWKNKEKKEVLDNNTRGRQ
jgi:hypothetical protein